MNPIEKIRDQFRRDLLLKLAAKQHKSRIIHLFNMRTMGIITLPPTEEERITLSQFISQMSRNGITVRKIETPPDTEIDKYGKPIWTLLYAGCLIQPSYCLPGHYPTHRRKNPQHLRPNNSRQRPDGAIGIPYQHAQCFDGNP